MRVAGTECLIKHRLVIFVGKFGVNVHEEALRISVEQKPDSCQNAIVDKEAVSSAKARFNQSFSGGERAESGSAAAIVRCK